MESNKKVWEDRNAQVVFSAHLFDLLKKRFETGFSYKNQGAGMVSTMVIKGHGINQKKISEIKKFLSETYSIKTEDLSKNHGSIKGTLVINISELSQESVSLVEDDFKKIIIRPIVESKKELDTTDCKIKQAESVEASTSDLMGEKLSVIKKGRFLISNFLTAVFKFEGIALPGGGSKIFSFDNECNEDIQILKFKKDEYAVIANKALSWYFGVESIPDREGSEIWLNVLDILKEKKTPSYPSYIYYTLPPNKADVDDIKKRAMRAFSGYTPVKVNITEDNKSFCILYSRLSTNVKFLGFVKDMGWNVEMINHNVVGYFGSKDVPIEIVSTAVETSVGSNEEEISSSAVSPIKGLFSQNEAFQKLREIFNDATRFQKLPSSKKENVIKVLRDNLEKFVSTEEFVNCILSTDRPLFDKWEIVAKLKIIISSSRNLPPVLQGKINSFLKENCSDEELVDELLNLF